MIAHHIFAFPGLSKNCEYIIMKLLFWTMFSIKMSKIHKMNSKIDFMCLPQNINILLMLFYIHASYLFFLLNFKTYPSVVSLEYVWNTTWSSVVSLYYFSSFNYFTNTYVNITSMPLLHINITIIPWCHLIPSPCLNFSDYFKNVLILFTLKIRTIT